MDAQRRQQTHHATRHAQGYLGKGPVLAERAPWQAVDAAGDALKLAGCNQPAEHHGRQALLSQIARTQQWPTPGEREDGLFER